MNGALADILEADQDRIASLHLGTSPAPDPLAKTYAHALFHYHAADVAELERVASSSELLKALTDAQRSWLRSVVAVRVLLKSGGLSVVSLSLVPPPPGSEGLEQAEWDFVVALAEDRLRRNEEAIAAYERARRGFTEHACPRKALICLHNRICVQSRAEPEKPLFKEYDFLRRQAGLLGETLVSGMALVNLSREHQKLGNLELALEHAELAITTLGNQRGSLNYYYALAQRVDVLMHLGRKDEATTELQACRECGDPEMKKIVGILEAALGLSRLPVGSTEQLTPAWVERWRNLREAPAFRVAEGTMEARLLSMLQEGARDKFDLMDELYGRQLSLDVKENRLKNLMNRLRNKIAPRLIHVSEGRYSLGADIEKTKNSEGQNP